jgi:hypothetical protein
MKSLAFSFVFFGLGTTAAAADDSCKAQAVANKFRGDEFKRRAIDQKVSDGISGVR